MALGTPGDNPWDRLWESLGDKSVDNDLTARLQHLSAGIISCRPVQPSVLPRRARPAAVRRTSDARMPDWLPATISTKPDSTASSHTGSRGHEVRQASMVSP